MIEGMARPTWLGSEESRREAARRTEMVRRGLQAMFWTFLCGVRDLESRSDFPAAWRTCNSCEEHVLPFCKNAISCRRACLMLRFLHRGSGRHLRQPSCPLMSLPTLLESRRPGVCGLCKARKDRYPLF